MHRDLEDDSDESDGDTAMELDTIPEEAEIAGTSNTSHRSHPLPFAHTGLDKLPTWLQPSFHALSIFAETFADVHLRSPFFQELRFIHDVVPQNDFYRECRVVRFGQVLDSDPEASGRALQYMMRFLGIMPEGREEDEALFWIPRILRRSE